MVQLQVPEQHLRTSSLVKLEPPVLALARVVESSFFILRLKTQAHLMIISVYEIQFVYPLSGFTFMMLMVGPFDDTCLMLKSMLHTYLKISNRR